jgi:proton-dependent oligopeptide transporter, POT family
METLANINKPQKGTYIIALGFMMNNIGLGTIYTLLVLYLENILHFNYQEAYYIWGTFYALLFCSSLVGGYLGDKFGHTLNILSGLALNSLGFAILALHTKASLFIGLGLFIAGSGLFIPNALYLLGSLYQKGNTKRDSAFVICFVLSNIGVLIAAILNGFLADLIGFNLAFVICALSNIIAFFIFFNYAIIIKKFMVNKRNLIATLLVTILISIICMLALKIARFSSELFFVALFIVIYKVTRLAINIHDKATRKNFLICILLMIISMIFWILSALAPSLLTNFIETDVQRKIFNVTIPAGVYFSLSPIFIITIAPLMSMLWSKLNKIGKGLPTVIKIALGIAFIGAAFILLFASLTVSGRYLVPSIWIVFTYLFLTLGEIFTAPVTQSMIGELVPSNQVGFLQGIRDFTIGLSGIIAGFLAQTALKNKHLILNSQILSYHFLIYGVFAISTATFIIILSKYKRHF